MTTLEDLTRIILDLFNQLPGVWKAVILLVLIALLIGLVVWKIVGIRKERRLKKQLRRKVAKLAQVSKERDELQDRIDDLSTVDEHIWRRSADCAIRFSESAKRTTRFIALCNFKGGVGKTTLTANLGACLAVQGKRVLLVDLDFQGTLSNLVLDQAQLEEYRQKNWTIERVLMEDASLDQVLEYSFPVTGVANCKAIISHETLSEVEFAQQARFFVDETREIRFLLRRLLHAESIFNAYDYVLFDCPPRLSTACLNALTCADYVVTPTSLSQSDIDAIPRTLNWLKRLSHIIPGEFLGAVICRCAIRKNELTRHEKLQYANLKALIAKHKTGDSYIFEAKIPDKSLIYQSTSTRKLAVLHPEGRILFEPVAKELERRIHR